ncbi:MAG TPA: methyltransferase domain-containing protein [Acidimicrobiia bacterium]|nr:methyltransferase domain-containing protein [Acidimicrobiia bacterium]
MAADFDALVAEGAAVPVDGWDFSWFDGRATEERPAWGYARQLAARLGAARAALDIQTGGGEVLVESPIVPPLLVATESFAPNVAVARRTLGVIGASLVLAGDDAGLPFRTGSFDLVASRHPTVTVWEEVARVLQPKGVYFSQQVGAGTLRELTDFMMGAQPVSDARSVPRAVAAAERAGLEVVDVRQASLRTVFFDVAAVTHFLRKVPWIVPDFTVERYRDRLAALHASIQRHGNFVAHAQRFLIEAHKLPGPVPT